MSRRPKNQGAAEELGNALTALRADAGSPSYDRIAKDLDKMGIDVTSDSIARAHAGLTDPSQVHAEMLLGLVRYYDVPESKLGFVAASRIRTIYSLANHPGPSTGGAISGESASPCTRSPEPATVLAFARAS